MTGSKTVRIVAVCLMLAVAGCSAIPGGGGSDSNENPAEETGQQSAISGLSTGTVTGQASGGALTRVDVTVTTATNGTRGLDVHNLTLQWVGNERVIGLVHEDSSAAGTTDGTYSTKAKTDPDGSYPILHGDDEAIITVNVTSLMDEGIEPGETVSLEISSESGLTADVVIDAPGTIPDEGEITL